MTSTEKLKQRIVDLKDQRREISKEDAKLIAEVRKNVAKRAALSTQIKDAAKEIKALHATRRAEAKEALKAARLAKKAAKATTKVVPVPEPVAAGAPAA